MKVHPQVAEHQPLSCPRRSAKHLPHNSLWQRRSGSLDDRDTGDPANFHPQAEDHRDEAPIRPDGARRCQRPASLVRYRHSATGRHSTRFASEASSRASSKAARATGPRPTGAIGAATLGNGAGGGNARLRSRRTSSSAWRLRTRAAQEVDSSKETSFT